MGFCQKKEPHREGVWVFHQSDLLKHGEKGLLLISFSLLSFNSLSLIRQQGKIKIEVIHLFLLHSPALEQCCLLMFLAQTNHNNYDSGYHISARQKSSVWWGKDEVTQRIPWVAERLLSDSCWLSHWEQNLQQLLINTDIKNARLEHLNIHTWSDQSWWEVSTVRKHLHGYTCLQKRLKLGPWRSTASMLL